MSKFSKSIIKKFNVQISVDHSGEFVASCSAAEGKVMVSGLYTKENNHSMTMGAAVSAITLDPIYARPGSGRRFMTGISKIKFLFAKLKFYSIF